MGGSPFLPCRALSPPTPNLLFLAQEKAYFLMRSQASQGSSGGEVGAAWAGPPCPLQLSFFLLCFSLGLTHTSSGLPRALAGLPGRRERHPLQAAWSNALDLLCRPGS